MTRYIIFTAMIIFFSSCSGSNGGGKYDEYQEEPDTAIESPYDDGSGHDAGFQWAEQKGITDSTDCGGDSDSFIEGCQEYVNSLPSDPVDAVEAAEMGEEMPYEDGR